MVNNVIHNKILKDLVKSTDVRMVKCPILARYYNAIFFNGKEIIREDVLLDKYDREETTIVPVLFNQYLTNTYGSDSSEICFMWDIYNKKIGWMIVFGDE